MPPTARQIGRGTLAALSSILLLSGSLATSATAAEPTQETAPNQTITADTINLAELTNFWDQYGVDEDVQQDLVDGISNGRLPDSVTGQGEVVDTTINEDETGSTTIQSFEDGSITVSQLELPADESTGDPTSTDPNAIDNCGYSGGSGYASYSHCDISGTNGIVTLAFVASYTLVYGGYDYISNHHTPMVVCFPGTCTDPQFTQVVYRESLNGDAGITATTVYSASDIGSVSNILSLVVGNDRAYTVFSPGEIG